MKFNNYDIISYIIIILGGISSYTRTTNTPPPLDSNTPQTTPTIISLLEVNTNPTKKNCSQTVIIKILVK